jgi:hypothetical protein
MVEERACKNQIKKAVVLTVPVKLMSLGEKAIDFYNAEINIQ